MDAGELELEDVDVVIGTTTTCFAYARVSWHRVIVDEAHVGPSNPHLLRTCAPPSMRTCAQAGGRRGGAQGRGGGAEP